MAKAQERKLSQLVSALPQRVMNADRVKSVSPEKGKHFLEQMEHSSRARAKLDLRLATPKAIDTRDGVRFTLANSDIVHFRQSGNAPELRCYVETNTA